MELLGLARAELSSEVERLGFPSYRGKQIADWLYKKCAHSLTELSNLPAAMREKLAQEATVSRAEIVTVSWSADGTAKYLLKLSDGQTIESVLLPYSDRTSVCVSTQVGCAAGCLFCATAMCGFVRNLTAGEIVDQVLTLQEHGGRKITHVVFMGMGEPLLNLDNLLKAMQLLNEEVGISMRRLTVSTVGITPAISKLAELDLPFTLALSLHAPDDELRKQIIPMARKYPLPELLQACRDYANTTKRRVTFEYLLLAGVNDAPEQAHKLAKLLHGLLGHVNLIPYNAVAGREFQRPSGKAVQAFRRILEAEGIEVTQRLERGHEVAAACGQLKRQSSS